MNKSNGWHVNNSFHKLIVPDHSQVVNQPHTRRRPMHIDHSAPSIHRDRLVPDPLRQLEREARRLRVELAGDRAAQLVVGLDLLMRRSAYRLIAACRGLADRVVAALHEPPGWVDRSTLRRTSATGPASPRGSGKQP
jgi:hypothetical protein